MYSVKHRALGPQHQHVQLGRQLGAITLSCPIAASHGGLTLRIGPGVGTYLCSTVSSPLVSPRVHQMFPSLLSSKHSHENAERSAVSSVDFNLQPKGGRLKIAV